MYVSMDTTGVFLFISMTGVGRGLASWSYHWSPRQKTLFSFQIFQNTRIFFSQLFWGSFGDFLVDRNSKGSVRVSTGEAGRASEAEKE